MADAGDPPVSRAADEAAQVEQIRQRLENITPGPWAIQGAHNDYEIIGAITGSENGWSVGTTVLDLDARRGRPTQADAEFIAHAPDDVAFLLSALAASQQARQQAEQERDAARQAEQAAYGRLAPICEALGLFNGARPEPVTAVVVREILPTIAALKANHPEAAIVIEENRRLMRLWSDALSKMAAANTRTEQAEARVRALEQATGMCIGCHLTVPGLAGICGDCWRKAQTEQAEVTDNVKPRRIKPPALPRHPRLATCPRCGATTDCITYEDARTQQRVVSCGACEYHRPAAALVEAEAPPGGAEMTLKKIRPAIFDPEHCAADRLTCLLNEPKDSSTIHYDEDTIPHGTCDDPIHCDCMCPECWRCKAEIIKAALAEAEAPQKEKDHA